MPVALNSLLGELQNPNISQAEIDAFHQEHFSTVAVELFTSDFLQPPTTYGEDTYDEKYCEEYYEEEDDGLGYYPDGVKRTLTDEQIAIFRHSELEALRRAKESATTNPATAVKTASALHMSTASSSDEGEVESDTAKPQAAKKRRRKKKKKSKNKSRSADHEYPEREPGWFKKNVKPDLRKRTWDVVEAGMDSLDYDGLEYAAASGSGHAAQRRKIAYDDD